MTAARMFLPPQHVGYVADVGLDFPAEFRTTLEKLGDMVWFRPRNGNTTRALNQYSGAVVGCVIESNNLPETRYLPTNPHASC
jgi:hypothetical protein